MKKGNYIALLSAVILLLVNISSNAQDDKSKRPSPPVVVEKTIDGLTITIDYSSPSVNGREIWGSLVKYNKIWRTGANEATTITFTKDVAIEGHAIAAGTYALFSIPSSSNDWVIIFSKDAEQWGSYKYNEKNDALRINVLAKKQGKLNEKLQFSIDDRGLVTMSWEYLSVSFDVD